MIDFETPIKDLARVGRATDKQLKRLGIETVKDLIFYFPRTYEDLTKLKSISELSVGEQATIRARLEQVKSFRSPRKRKIITQAVAADETGSLRLVWFNQAYLGKALRLGSWYYFSGKVDDRYHFEMTSPIWELARLGGEQLHTNRVVPIYSLTEGVSQKQLRWLIKLALPLAGQIKEWLPQDILKKEEFLPIEESIKQIHFPDDLETAEKSYDRFKFGELFLLQLVAARSRNNLKSLRASKIKIKPQALNKSFEKLPFTLTPDQRTSLKEIIFDISNDRPMNRLIEGDVGSGKTIVTALALEQVLASGYQVMVMAPTAILAEQHFNSFLKFFENKNVNVGILTRTKSQILQNQVKEKEMRQLLESGEAHLVIGTHSLIQDKVRFKNLGLAVIDEQHRFGVKQRQALREKNLSNFWPHLLSLTATPIPRSLALTLYGDLDISIIKTLPPGRKPAQTRVVGNDQRQSAYDFINKEVAQGGQGFVVCPLIEPSDKLGVRSVKQEYEKLCEVFPDLKIGLLHGRLKPEDKEKVMNDFKNKELDLLVSTSVIEVGIDVPNATIMIIEGAERFGLAQLHQLRGRIGRSDMQSYCFLFTENENEKTGQRLKMFQDSNDGFELAEADLELRGPGDIYGWEQSGFPKLKWAKLTDRVLLKRAQKYARDIIDKNNIDKNPELKNQLEQFERTIHFE